MQSASDSQMFIYNILWLSHLPYQLLNTSNINFSNKYNWPFINSFIKLYIADPFDLFNQFKIVGFRYF